MNRLYFIRHGEGQDNAAMRFSYKRIDHSLTARGILQAQQTAEYIKARNFENLEIYTSPMKLAYETARIITTSVHKELTVLEEFREVNVGSLEGASFNAENWSIYQQVVSRWFAGDRSASMPGGEDYLTLWGRMRAGLYQMMNGKSGSNLVLVGHAGIFTATLKDLCPGIDVNWLLNAECYNCSITELEVEMVNGVLQGKLIDWANYQHLGAEALIRIPGIPPIESLQENMK
jgi:broad specificity phosphatase PhoE